jgi:hypothetical protein
VLNRLQTTVLMLMSLVLSANFAMAQPNEVVRETTLKGTVEAVDHAARTVRIRGASGDVVTLDIPQSVTSFEKLQVADVVSVGYYDRVAVRLKAPGESAVDRTEPPVKTSTAGALPGAAVATQRVATVTITAWDPAARLVTFTSANGTVYSRHLQETSEPIMSGIKVGDRVDLTRTEAVRLAVESRQAITVDATEDFRHRFTIAALWAWDNQFSGNLIKEASGTATNGVPINLTETTYDDVYGRMAMFKIGAAYRTTPRTEGVVNFVLSRSGAELANVGTAGNTPLNVQFDDYNYWGVEGGQRFFFTRVRVTPYVGYLVGINRYDDIRGEFVNPPPGASAPGYAAQDHKFFEKSWALSLGPTGGVLIGLGPFELVAEAQLRYMGKLSDVDWLVEEGLKDINDESSRWSFPVQFGARIRF